MDSSRRAFLAQDFPAKAKDPDPRGGTGGQTFLRMRREAMGSVFEIFLPGEDRAQEAGSAALDRVNRLDDQLTVYRDTSELCALNRLAADTAVQPDREIFALLVQSKRLWSESAGLFDISSLPLSRLWGFFRREGRTPSDAEIAETLERVGMEKVCLDEAAESVQFTRPGVEISFNSIGKGYALDRAAGVLEERGQHRALLHGGFSSLYGLGAPPGELGWLIALRNPLDVSKPLAQVRLANLAVGTAGGEEQYFEAAGRRYSHILDPRTGRPAEGMLSVSVFAASATVADALATTFYIGGVAFAREYCDTHPGVGAILLPGRVQDTTDIGDSGEAHSPKVVMAGTLPDDLEVFVSE